MTLSTEWPEEAVYRAREGALDWLKNNGDGFPRSRHQESLEDARRGYAMYDQFEAPPIVGYEELEREGLVTRLETVSRDDGQERIHFRLNNGEAASK